MQLFENRAYGSAKYILSLFIEYKKTFMWCGWLTHVHSKTRLLYYIIVSATAAETLAGLEDHIVKYEKEINNLKILIFIVLSRVTNEHYLLYLLHEKTDDWLLPIVTIVHNASKHSYFFWKKMFYWATKNYWQICEKALVHLRVSAIREQKKVSKVHHQTFAKQKNNQ